MSLLALLPLCLVAQPVPQWSQLRHLGTNGSNGGSNVLLQVVADAVGGYYACGSFSNTLAFGTQVRQAPIAGSGFLVHYDGTGTVQWVRTLAGAGGEALVAVCALPGGGCAVTGTFGAQALLEGAAAPFATSGFLTATYDVGGALTWVDVTGAGPVPQPTGLVTDAVGQLYVLGQMQAGNRSFGGIAVTFPPNTLAQLPFVCCYGTNRQLRWVKATAANFSDAYPQGITATANGCAVTATYEGRTNGNILGFPVGTTRNDVDFDGALVALDSLGNTLWGCDIKNPYWRSGLLSLAAPLVVANQVVLVGAADTTLTFSGSSLALNGTANQHRTFLARFHAATGTLDSLRVLAEPLPSSSPRNRAVPTALRLNPSGLYLGGYFTGRMQFAGQPPLAAAAPNVDDGFVAKYDLSGTTCQWVATARNAPTALISSSYAQVADVAVLPSGTVVAGGNFGSYTSPLTLGSTTFTAGSISDIFLGHLDAVTGLPEKAPQVRAELTAWPNPAREQVQLRLPAGTPPGMARLLDALGREVRHMPVNGETTLDVRGLPAGVYVLRVAAGPRIFTRRLVVQR